MDINQTSVLPLVIGITGHRNIRLADKHILSTKIHAFFDELLTTYPHTPLLLLSPLAEGADRLVAEIAFKKGIEVIAPLPFNSELYESDFNKGEMVLSNLSTFNSIKVNLSFFVVLKFI